MFLSSSRLAAHCIECQGFPMGTESRDALAHQQVALNLIFSHSSHLLPLLYTTPPLKPQLPRITWPTLDATLSNFCRRILIFYSKMGAEQMTIHQTEPCRWLRLSSRPADVHWPAINGFKPLQPAAFYLHLISIPESHRPTHIKLTNGWSPEAIWSIHSKQSEVVFKEL